MIAEKMEVGISGNIICHHAGGGVVA